VNDSPTLEPSQLAAWIFFLLVLVFAAAVVALLIRRSGLSPFQFLLWILGWLLCKLLWRARWLTPLRLPEGQGAVIVCNHRSSVDPFFLQTMTMRKMHWMVAREYCEHPALRWFLSSCEVIPVSRGGVDTASTKAAIRLASAGDIVGMLPEGRINMSEQFMLPARPGAALVALKARVPVIPCYIKGSPYWRYSWSPLTMRARVEVRCGEPIDLSEFYGREGEPQVFEEVTRRMLKAIAALAGQTDFEPQIAGRKWKPTEEEIQQAMDDADKRKSAG
jgi:1-acyl-sn-glycerol-3-phosphate acyltransferase